MYTSTKVITRLNVFKCASFYEYNHLPDIFAINENNKKKYIILLLTFILAVVFPNNTTKNKNVREIKAKTLFFSSLWHHIILIIHIIPFHDLLCCMVLVVLAYRVRRIRWANSFIHISNSFFWWKKLEYLGDFSYFRSLKRNYLSISSKFFNHNIFRAAFLQKNVWTKFIWFVFVQHNINMYFKGDIRVILYKKLPIKTKF